MNIPTIPVKIACGDDYAAFLGINGSVYSMGGLFSDPPSQSYFYHKRSSTFTQSPPGFFPGKLISLVGKYNYHAALLEN